MVRTVPSTTVHYNYIVCYFKLKVVSGGSSVGLGGGSGQNVSPVAAHKGLMKLTTPFRNRSPTGQSPVNKTRKPSQTNNGELFFYN